MSLPLQQYNSAPTQTFQALIICPEPDKVLMHGSFHIFDQWFQRGSLSEKTFFSATVSGFCLGCDQVTFFKIRIKFNSHISKYNEKHTVFV